MKKYFDFYQTSNNGWSICPIHKEWIGEDYSKQVKGSFNLLACRVSGLSWSNWLKYCRKNGASLYGKGHKYVVAVWKEPNYDILNILNQRANELAKIINLNELNL